MAEHFVKFSVPYRRLGRSDIKFKVYTGNDNRLFGTLLVSHGAIEWRPTRKQKKIKKDWAEFNRMMTRKK